MAKQKLTYENEQGEKLAVRLDLPEAGQPVAYALFAHCFTCNKNLRAIAHISRALKDEGIGVISFDFTGLGESDGDFADTNFSSNVQDLVAVAEQSIAEGRPPSILIGHSLGGAAALRAAGQLPSIKAVATIGSPYEPSHVLGLMGEGAEKIETEGVAEVTIVGRPFRIKKQFIEDLNQTSMDESIGNLRRPLLVLHAPFDKTVGIDNAAKIFEAARHPKSFVSLDRADHLLSDNADSHYAGSVIAAWARRYLPIVEEQAAEDPRIQPGGKPGEVLVRIEKEHYRSEVWAGRHHLVADEPVRVGGTDEGPTPYDLLNGALGACTAITLRMYADRKNLPLEAVEVRVNHSKIHANECEECESEKGTVDHFERELKLFGPLDEAQRTRLLEIADRCPVHRTLDSENHITTKFVASPEPEG